MCGHMSADCECGDGELLLNVGRKRGKTATSTSFNSGQTAYFQVEPFPFGLMQLYGVDVTMLSVRLRIKKADLEDFTEVMRTWRYKVEEERGQLPTHDGMTIVRLTKEQQL